MLTDLAAWAEEQLAVDGAPSLSFAVGIGRDVVFAEAVGVANRDQERPATPATAYLLASVTKPITATAVCLLAEQGTIDLDEPAQQYLDGVTLPVHREASSPTVRHLLQHRAGLGTHYRFFYDYRATPAPAFDEVVARYGHVLSAPGTRFEYSNLGYGILDEVIRVASGSEPAAVVRKMVFEPLSMSSAQVGPSYEGDAPVAARYAKDGVVYPDYDVDHRGASLAWSSAPDLVRFGLAHAGGPSVVSDATVRQMRSTLPSGDGPGGYGLGWGSIEIDGIVVVMHAGGMGGVSTQLLVVPEARVAIAALTNGTGSDLPRLAMRHLVREFVPTLQIPEGLWESAGDVLPPPGVPPGALGRWEGSVETYAGDVPIRLELDGDGSDTGWLGDEGPAPCTPVHPGQRDLALAIPLQLPTPDAMVSSPTITCHLDLHDDTLHGTVLAEDDATREPVGNCMTHRSELSRP